MVYDYFWRAARSSLFFSSVFFESFLAILYLGAVQ